MQYLSGMTNAEINQVFVSRMQGLQPSTRRLQTEPPPVGNKEVTMPEENGTTPNGFTEAPASFNVKALSPAGFDVMLTLRGVTGAALLPKAIASLDWLAAQGFKPTGRPINATATPQAAGNSSPANGNGSPEPDSMICPLHHAPMQRREKNGQAWYSHKAVDPATGEEYWCKGKPR